MISQAKQNVLYIDTCGGFSAERLEEILKTKYTGYPQVGTVMHVDYPLDWKKSYRLVYGLWLTSLLRSLLIWAESCQESFKLGAYSRWLLNQSDLTLGQVLLESTFVIVLLVVYCQFFCGLSLRYDTKVCLLFLKLWTGILLLHNYFKMINFKFNMNDMVLFHRPPPRAWDIK